MHDGPELFKGLPPLSTVVWGGTSVLYCSEIRAIIGESEGSSVSAANVWPFLQEPENFLTFLPVFRL
jgi:hypothetical protein